MERKRNVILFVVLMMFLTSITMAEKQITRLNTNPLMKVSGGIKSTDEFKRLVEKYADRIKEGFEQTGEASLYSAFMEQVRSGNIEESTLPKGQRFKWMIFYPKKQVKVTPDVEWAGKTTIKAYVVKVSQEQECKNFRFFIPRVCGNIGFVEEAAGDVICSIAITPREVQSGESFTVDLGGSKCSVNYEITVSREGNRVDTKNLRGEKSWQTSYQEPGVYEFTAQALNSLGVASTNECRASITITRAPEVEPTPTTPEPPSSVPGAGAKKLFILAEAGPLFAKGTYTMFIFARVGLDYFFIPDKLCVLVSAGYAVNLGSDVFKSHFLSNILVNVHFQRFFVGAGVGFSSKVRNATLEDGVIRPEWKSDIDIVGNVGYDIFTTPTKKGSLFGEIRIPIDKDLEFSKDHVLALGFRLLF